MAQFRLEVGYSTDVGRLRKRNEDSYAVYSPAVEHAMAEPLQGMLLVADGMGGERAGDRASQMAAEGLHQCFASGTYRSWPEFGNGNAERIGENLALIEHHERYFSTRPGATAFRLRRARAARQC